MYCSLSDIREMMDQDTLIDLLNNEKRSIDEIDLSGDDDPIVIRANGCIKDADNEINTALGSRYIVPFTSVPDRVVFFSKEISVYNIYLQRRRQVMDEQLTVRYKQIKQELKDLANGTGVLEGAQLIGSGAAGSGAGVFVGSKKESDRIFSKDLLGKI